MEGRDEGEEPARERIRLREREERDRFRVIRPIGRTHPVPDLGRIFCPWEPGGDRSTCLLNARTSPANGLDPCHSSP